VDLTYAQDPGAVTELLSGDFYEPFGRSTSHQLWSSAMVLIPLLRGMFGLQVNGMEHTLRMTPQLPADWNNVALKRVRVGASVVDIECRRSDGAWVVNLVQREGPPVRLEGAGGDGRSLQFPVPAVEIQLPHGLPMRGSRTGGLKVLSETRTPRSLRLELEASGGTFDLKLRRNTKAAVTAEGATLQSNGDLQISFGEATTSYATRVVTLRW